MFKTKHFSGGVYPQTTHPHPPTPQIMVYLKYTIGGGGGITALEIRKWLFRPPPLDKLLSAALPLQ